MTDLTKNIRSVSKRGNNLPAIVIGISGDRATIRLSNNGAIYRTLKVVGGPVSINQKVQVDMSTDIPYIIAPSISYAGEVTARAIQRPKIAYASPYPDLSEAILHYDYSENVINKYPITSQGLTDALGVCETKDTVTIPVCTLEGDFTVLSNSSLIGKNRETSVIWGTVTMSSDTNITTLTILDEISSGSDNAIALFGPTSGELVISNVTASAYTCGNGNAYGLYQQYGGNADITNSKIVGESRNGDGYGVYQEDAP